MQIALAMDTLAKAAGDDVHSFLVRGEEPRRDFVSDEVVLHAGEVLTRAMIADRPELAEAHSWDALVGGTIRECKAQTFEALWHSLVKDVVKTPAKRVPLLGFLEARAGRSSALDPE